jgi:hypothetical protein
VLLPGPRAKLKRAHEHLQALDGECRGFLYSEPYYVTAKFEPEAGCFVVRLRIREDVPIRFSLIVGDLIHNLRSALDQAAWLVACRSTPVEQLWRPDTARKIAFPLAPSRERFEGHSIMPFIALDARAILEPLQPYHLEDTPQALGRLNELWNIDKHRVVHAGLGKIVLSKVAFRPRAIDPSDLVDGGSEVSFAAWGAEVEDGTELATVVFKSGQGPPATGVDITEQPGAQIIFGAKGRPEGANRARRP